MSSPPPLFDRDNLPRLDERRESLTRFLGSEADGTYYVGHACVLVRIHGKKFIFDAVTQRPLLLNSWLYFPPQVMDARLLDVDGVFISHFHEDHYDPRYLCQIPKGTPVYILEQRPMFEAWLRDIGANVRTLPARKLVEVEPGVSAYAMPSEYNQIDSSFMLRGENLCVYQGNDNFLTAQTLAQARKDVGAADHAFVPYAYIWWYPFRLGSIDAERRDAEGQRMVTKYLDLGIEHARLLEAEVVVPCGGNLVYHDHVDSLINRAVYTPYDFADYAREHAPDIADRVMPLVAGDYALKVDGASELFWARSSTETYTRRLAAFLAEWAANDPTHLSPPRATTQETVAFLARRIEPGEVPALDYEISFERADDPNVGLCVDLATKSIALRPGTAGDRPWIRFVLEPVAFDAWLREDVIFEVVLESARFTVFRQPEVHDPKVWEVLRLYF